MPISELTGVITVSVFVVNTFFLFYWELLEHFILYFLSLWMTLHVLWEWHEWRCSSYCSEHRLPLLLLLSLVPLLFACLCFPSFSCIVFYSYYLFSVVRFLLLLIFSLFPSPLNLSLCLSDKSYQRAPTSIFHHYHYTFSHLPFPSPVIISPFSF